MTYSTTHSNLHLMQGQPNQLQAEIQHDRYGMLVAARLSDATGALPYDISERLRAARVQALAKRKMPARTASAVVSNGSSAALTLGGDEKPGFWGRMASVLPLVALVAGLVAINVIQNEDRANELAEVDTALLTDDLPPAAYADPGFVQFLRAGSEPSNP
jgi:hypothetical protein